MDVLSETSHGEAPKADLSYLPETMPVIIGTRKAVSSRSKKRSRSWEISLKLTALLAVFCSTKMAVFVPDIIFEGVL